MHIFTAVCICMLFALYILNGISYANLLNKWAQKWSKPKIKKQEKTNLADKMIPKCKNLFTKIVCVWFKRSFSLVRNFAWFYTFNDRMSSKLFPNHLQNHWRNFVSMHKIRRNFPKLILCDLWNLQKFKPT